MTDSFDLTTEPWIPCERMDGTTVELSTRDTLEQAHELRGIVDPSPLIQAALHRHLLAILHRTYEGPRTLSAWANIYGSGAFDHARVNDYLDRVQDRLDLFHPTHPFAQTRGLVEQFEASPIDMLTVERSSWGTARELFQHRRTDYQPTLSPAEAARHLLAHQAFAPGGLVKKPGEPTAASAAPLVRAAVVLLKGQSLFYTLMANLLRYNPNEALPIAGDESDRPSWEQPPPPRELRMAKEPTKLPAGWLELLTFLSRRIELVRKEGQVTGFVRAVGQGLAEGTAQDPMVSYKIDEKRGFVSVGINPDRALWRDANAFFEKAHQHNRFVRPQAIDQIGNLLAAGHLDDASTFTLELHGMSADKSKIELVRSERVLASARHFDDPDARDVVEQALIFSNDGVEALRSALWLYGLKMLSEGARTPETKDIRAFVDSLCAEPAVWSALGVEFELLLRGLDGDKAAALREFQDKASERVRSAFKLAISIADNTARSLRAQTIARDKLFQSKIMRPNRPMEASHGET